MTALVLSVTVVAHFRYGYFISSMCPLVYPWHGGFTGLAPGIGAISMALCAGSSVYFLCMASIASSSWVCLVSTSDEISMVETPLWCQVHVTLVVSILVC